LETICNTQGNDLGHSKNVKDWVIRRRKPKYDMIVYGFVSTIAKVWVSNECLINMNLLKVRSSPLWKHKGSSDGWVGVCQLRCIFPINFSKLLKNIFLLKKLLKNIYFIKIMYFHKIYKDFYYYNSNRMSSVKSNKYFIDEIKKIHGDKYDYSKINYINSYTNVIVVCPKHGEQNINPRIIIRGKICFNCGKEKKVKTKKTTEYFINELKEIYGDTYDYSKVNYIRNNIKVIIICKKHNNEFEKMPISLLKRNGCLKCSKEKRLKYLSDNFIKRSKEIYGDRFDYSKVEYISSTSKVIIICKEHGEFKQRPEAHCDKSKGSCSMCKDKKNKKPKTKKKIITTSIFIERAKKIHGDKYDYSKVKYENKNNKVIIICKEHGEFKKKPYNFLGGSKCPKCCKNYSPTTEEWIEKAKYVYDDFYDYKKVNYVNNREKIIITCKEHGDFNVQPFEFIRKRHQCPKCSLCSKCKSFNSVSNLCEWCDPDSEHYKNTKEMKIVRFLRENLLNVYFFHNKSIGRDCTNGHLFPDIRFDCLYYNLIVEVDEFQHRGANYKCDERRMYDIIAKLGQPCVFIRYNPDNKKSSKEYLLDRVKYYLDYKTINIKDTFSMAGLKTEYLFYD